MIKELRLSMQPQSVLNIKIKKKMHMFSMFLFSYRNTRESVGELEKVVESTSTTFHY